MDWLKLLILLVAVASTRVKADGPKKKIRIHLPQTVKHIHHHKKIYITNHPAPSQYAPAYMPSAEGAVAVPTNIALPSVANIVPLNSVDILEESVRMPGLTASASKLLPLYRARGYYGPTRTEFDEQDYDIATHPDPADSYIVPTSILSTSPDASHHSPKRVKLVKVSELPRKKTIRKVKPKRAPIRKPSSSVRQENEHPVSTFHEQFYSDLQDASTIRKTRKPQRVEKIVDGNTEHIHTYSEEHIHKVVFDEEPKYTGVVGVEPIGAVPAYAHSFIPFKNTQIVALASDPYRTLAVPGSMGTPSQYEYAAYNPREVTHDHIFHDHGEVPEEIAVMKDMISLPPKVSYNSQGVRLDSGIPKRIKNRYAQRPTRPPPTDYTYYENIYSSSRVKPKSTAPTSLYASSQNENINQLKPVSTYRYKDGISSKSRNKIPTYYGKPLSSYRTKQPPTSVPAPFSVQSKIIHDYKPNPQNYAGAALASNGLSANNDPFANFKDSYVNNFEYDNYASPSHVLRTEYKSHHNYGVRKGRKKSTSSQNMQIEPHNHVKYSDSSPNESILLDENDGAPSALESLDSYDQSPFYDSVTETSYNTKETPSPYQYYTVMAIKALSDDQLSVPEASNDNYQYAEAPTISTTPSPVVATTTPQTRQSQTNSNDFTTQSPELIDGARHNRYTENKAIIPPRESVREAKEKQSVGNFHKPRLQQSDRQTVNVISNQSTERVKVRYGDKI